MKFTDLNNLWQVTYNKRSFRDPQLLTDNSVLNVHKYNSPNAKDIQFTIDQFARRYLKQDGMFLILKVDDESRKSTNCTANQSILILYIFFQIGSYVSVSSQANQGQDSKF